MQDNFAIFDAHGCTCGAPLENGECIACGARRSRARLPESLFDSVPWEAALYAEALCAEHLHRFSIEELTTPAPPVEWVWRPRIARGKVVLLGGAGGGLKTSFTVGLAVHRAIGRDYLGCPVTQGGTLFVTAEDDALDYRRKLQAWTCSIDLGDGDERVSNLRAISENVHVLDLTGRASRLVRRDRGGGYAIDPLAEGIAALVGGDSVRGAQPSRVDLVVGETANRFGADETNEGAGYQIAAWEVIARRGPAVLLVGHVAKAAAREGFTGQHAFRGASAFSDNSRGELVLAPLDPDEAEANGIERDFAGRYSILSTPKPHPTVLRPPPLVLERASPPVEGLGGVLRLRDASPGASAVRAVASILRRRQISERLRGVVARLSDNHVTPTETRLREHLGEIGVGKHRLRDAIRDALSDGFLVEGDRTRGGGTSLLPGNPPDSAHPDSAQGRKGDSHSPIPPLPKGASERRASSEEQPAQTRPESEPDSGASSGSAREEASR